MNQPPVVPITAIDLATLVPRSVASLYSHLVTRPTGRALRMGIESQIGDLGRFCVSVLDFSQVVVLDYSCADEVVAKLIQRFQRADRPADAYFVARGLGEEHRDPIEEVLCRHRLSLVAEIGGHYTLLGYASQYEQAVWHLLQKLSSAETEDVAAHISCTHTDAACALDALVEKRALLRLANATRYYSLTALLSL